MQSQQWPPMSVKLIALALSNRNLHVSAQSMLTYKTGQAGHQGISNRYRSSDLIRFPVPPSLFTDSCFYRGYRMSSRRIAMIRHHRL